MSVKLRKKTAADGGTILYLDIYRNKKRSYEFLKDCRLEKATSAKARESNKQKMDLAKEIRNKREMEFTARGYNIKTDTGKNTDVCEWMQGFVDKYKKKDKRNMSGVLGRFKTFLHDNKLTGLTFGQLTGVVIEEFRERLKDECEGEGASSYFARFKRMIKKAHSEKLIDFNPASDVKSIKVDPRIKDVLTLDEISKIYETKCESPEVKNAFIFCCMTGLRWCDVKELNWGNIKNSALTFKQGKTGKYVSQNLNDVAIEMIGKPGKTDDLIFDLPTANGCNKTLKALIKRAGIDKKITWHQGRHSFGTNLLFTGTDIYTASNLLGHKGLTHTMRYVRASNDLKQQATQNLDFTKKKS